MKKLKLKLSFVFVFFITMLWADPPILPQPGTTNSAPGSIGAPLDDGVVVLLILALIYGLYKLYKQRRISAKTNPE
jgi:hypothetical protein